MPPWVFVKRYEFKTNHEEWVRTAKPKLGPHISARVLAAINTTHDNIKTFYEVLTETPAVLKIILKVNGHPCSGRSKKSFVPKRGKVPNLNAVDSGLWCLLWILSKRSTSSDLKRSEKAGETNKRVPSLPLNVVLLCSSIHRLKIKGVHLIPRFLLNFVMILGGSEFPVLDPVTLVSDEAGLMYCLCIIKSSNMNIIGRDSDQGSTTISTTPSKAVPPATSIREATKETGNVSILQLALHV
ncbi:hypothetical protein GIB67_037865 [Kingdonia uniflora]|uniref:Uncharacterized protein n=1 Tax=Kingdonia uniflora TaxID=39325 RepID=A0A7J7LGZ5_9MAGN|nr:hypothetical protein GIB67_037865 [Kingdonia uniflora]